MPKKNRAYKSAKRSKELDRLRKQEEKRLRRLHKLENPEETPVEPGAAPEGEAGASEETDAPETGDPD